MKNQALELHSPLPKSFKVCKERTMEKRKTEDSSCNILSHFWSTFRSSFFTYYIPFQSSGSQESNASNRVRFGAEMRKIWPSEANCSSFSKYGCYVMAWMQSHGNFSHPEVISYELLEGEVFNSKFRINPLEPISMAIESTVMRGHRLDEAQMIMLFPLSLSGAAQCWFASLDPLRRRTWADLGQEFIRQYSFNTIVDVSRRELEALSLQSRFAKHLMGFPQTDFGSLMQALYGIEEGISRGHQSSRRPLFQSQFLGTPYQMIHHGQYRPVAPIRPVGPTYLHPPPQLVYATQAPQRPPMQFYHQYRAPPPPRPVRQFTQLGMPLSRAFQRLRAGHDTDSCSALRHAIQDLIDQGLVDLGRPGVAIDRYLLMTLEQYLHPRKGIYGPPPVSPVYLQHVPPMTPFILFPEEYRPPHRDVQIVTRSGRVAQPPPVDRPFVGIAAREEVQREDDEILRQLRTT
ncbi:hypothetical protein CK203_064062 [Vitis vinifera]|uniref:Retrotransposon gag domain-containing protein n=1 Tax=Vitis vinifera TaxID=29760 RepID=A0A438G434_VITVI|nr:hypothetical protein CK203_064062 [Vitis vinifera]